MIVNMKAKWNKVSFHCWHREARVWQEPAPPFPAHRNRCTRHANGVSGETNNSLYRCLLFDISPVLTIHSVDKFHNIINENILHLLAFFSGCLFWGSAGTEVS